MELLDVVDEAGSPTGVFKSRKEAHQDGLWHRTVHIWIVTKKNEIVMQRRSQKKDVDPGKWSMAVAGHISAGISSLATAIKETKEELGLNISELEINFLFSTKESNDYDHVKEREFHDVYLVEKDVTLEELRMQSEEVDELKLVGLQELEEWFNHSPEDFRKHPEEYKKIFSIFRERYT